MHARVGTSGWSYPEWQPAFYPGDLPRSRFLEHYAGRLDACEINATFYRIQSEHAVRRWAEATPNDFRFAAKLHRGISHARALATDDDWRGLLERQISSLAPLGARLGALLIQLPPYRRRDDDALTRLLDAIDARLPVAVEFRHSSWDDPDVTHLVVERGGTVCLADESGDAPPRLPPGPLAYVRLRATHYSDAQRAAWAELLAQSAASRPVLAFTKHKDLPADDAHCGVGMAAWLVDHLR